MTDKLSDKLLIIPKRGVFPIRVLSHIFSISKENERRAVFPLFYLFTLSKPIACSHNKGQLDIGIVVFKDARWEPKASP